MKTKARITAGLAIASVSATCILAFAAQPAAPASDSASHPKWGKTENPEGDCKFQFTDNRLVISVPGGDTPHDLSAELGNMNSPRVLQSVTGDFTFQVKVDGDFVPGGESSQAGRTGYNGAGILIMNDAENYIRLERATLQAGSGQPRPYANFEIRVNGQNQRFGTTGDAEIHAGKPTYLWVKRRGNSIEGGVSHDGETWEYLPAKDLPAGWPSTVQVGVAAVSTSKADFTPAFSELKVTTAKK